MGAEALAWVLVVVSAYALCVTLVALIYAAAIDEANRAEVNRLRAERAENNARTLLHIVREQRGADA